MARPDDFDDPWVGEAETDKFWRHMTHGHFLGQAPTLQEGAGAQLQERVAQSIEQPIDRRGPRPGAWDNMHAHCDHANSYCKVWDDEVEHQAKYLTGEL
jgi:hypothetical protein